MLSQIEGVIKITKKNLEDIYNQNVKTITPSSFDGDENSIFEITEDIEIYEDMTLSGINNVLISNRTIINNGKISNCHGWFMSCSNIINNNTIDNCIDWNIIYSNITNNNLIINCGYFPFYNWSLCVSNITNNGIIGGCIWELYLSNITNNYKIDTGLWIICASKLKNCIIMNAVDWKIIASSITDGDIKSCNNWFLFASKLSNCNISNDCVDLHTAFDYIELPIIKKEDYDKLQNKYNKLKNITINNNVNVKDDKLRKLLLLTYLNQKDNSNVLQNLIK